MRRKKIGKRLFSLLVTVLLVGTMPFSGMPVMAGTVDVVQETETVEPDKDVDETTEASELTTAKAPEVTTGAAPEATTTIVEEVTTEAPETTTAGTTATEVVPGIDNTTVTETTTADATTEAPGNESMGDSEENTNVSNEESIMNNRSANEESYHLDGNFYSSVQLADNSPMYKSVANVETSAGGKVRYDSNGLYVFTCGSGNLKFTVKADEGYRLVSLTPSVEGANTDDKSAFYQVTKQDDTSAEITLKHPDIGGLSYNNHEHGLSWSPTLKISVKATFEKIPEAKKSLCIGTKFESEDTAGRVVAYKYQNESWENIGSVGFDCEEKDFLDLTSSIDIGTQIRLEAIPAPGSSFNGWGGLTDELQSSMQESTIEFAMPKADLKLIAGFSKAVINESGKMTYINGDKTKAKTVVFESFDKELYQSKVEVTAETGGYVSYSGNDNAIFGCGTGELKFHVFADKGYEFDRFVYDRSGVVDENYKEDEFFEGNKPNNKNGEVTVKHNDTLLTEGRNHNHHHGCLDSAVLSLKVTAKFKKVSQDVSVQINYLSGTDSIREAYHSSTIYVDSSKTSISYKELKSLVNGIDQVMLAEIKKEDQTYFVENLPKDDTITYNIENGKVIINLQYYKEDTSKWNPLNVVVKYVDSQDKEITFHKSYTEQVKVEKLETGYNYKELQEMFSGFDLAIKDTIEDKKSSEVYVLNEKPGTDTRFEVKGNTVTVTLNYKLQYNVRVVFDYKNENNAPIAGYGEGAMMRIDSSEGAFSYGVIKELVGTEQWNKVVVEHFISKDDKFYKLMKEPTTEQTFGIEMVNGFRTITIPLIYGEEKQTVALKVNVQYQNAQGQALTEHPAKEFKLQVEKLKDSYTYKDLKDLNSEELNKAIVTELTVGGRTYELTKALTDDQVLTYEDGQVTLILQYKEKSTGGGTTGGGTTGGGTTGGGSTTPSNPDNNGNVTPPANDDVIVDDDEVPLAPGTDDTDANDTNDDSIEDDNDVTVDDEDVPLAKQPDKDAKDKVSKDKVSKNKDNSEVNVEDDKVPLANLPKTGDVSNHFGAVALPAGLLMVLQLLKRRDKTSKETK